MIKHFYIRADGNTQIGTGHIMRCISIANKIRQYNGEVTFIVADKYSEAIVLDYGYNAICMNTQWNDLDKEIPHIISIIKKYNIKTILIDHYYVTNFYLTQLKKRVELSYLDDLNQFIYPVNHLINYNFYAEDLNYMERYRLNNEMTDFYLGTKYVPLRSEFEKMKTRTYKGIKKILLSSGGTDNYNIIGRILKTFLEDPKLKQYEYYCIIGRFNNNYEKLCESYENYDNIHLLRNVKKMSEYMMLCDICITAGGTTTYELCACGIPSINYTIADNQLNFAKKMMELRIMPWVGDVRGNVENCLEQMKKELVRYADPYIWENTSKVMQSYVDGNGADRIARLLIRE